MQDPEGQVIARPARALLRTSTITKKQKRRRVHFPYQPQQARATKLQERDTQSTNEEKKCNCLFLCFGLYGQDYVTKVDIAWPGRANRRRLLYMSEWVAIYKNKKPDDRGIKQSSPEEVMKEIHREIYRQVGRWKEYLPCYELHAEEVNFRYDDLPGTKSKACITRLDAEQIKNDAEQLRYDSEYGSGVYAGEEEADAYARIKGYPRRDWLTTAIRTPEEINARQFLYTGLLQKSFIYTMMPELSNDTISDDPYRGIYITFSWNLLRLGKHLFYGSCCLWVLASFGFLATFVWAGRTGDWSTAFTLGSLVIATITLLVQHT